MDREAEVERLLVEYLAAAEAGSAPSPDVWADQHPEFRAEILEFFALRGYIGGLAAAAQEALSTPRDRADDKVTSFPLPFGKYTLLGVFGHGGMGVVYRAEQDDPRRVVALKMIRAGQFATPDDRARFRVETEVAVSLSHPNIVSVYEAGQVIGRPYYTMPVMAGDLRGRGAVFSQPLAAANLVRELAGALDHAHRRGVLHRDLKPSNVLFDADGRPHLSDFGLAKLVSGSGELTRTGDIVGNPAFMPPEQAAGESATFASDVYGLGCILYFALAGRGPFDDGPPAAVLERVRTSSPPRLRITIPTISRDLEAICLKCLAKEAGDRYSSAADLIADLDRFLSGRPVQARPVPLIVRTSRWVRRRPVEAAALFASLLIASIAAGVAIDLWAKHLQSQANADAADARRGEAEAREKAHGLAADAQRDDDKDVAAGRELLSRRRLAQEAGWTEENLADIRRLAARRLAKEDPAPFRSEAAAALVAVDLGTPRVLAEGFKAHSLGVTHGWPEEWIALGGWFPNKGNLCEVRILEVTSGREVRRVTYETDPDWERRNGKRNTDGCRSVAFSYGGRWLVIGTRSGWLVRWDLRESEPKPVRWRHAPAAGGGHEEAHREAVERLAFDGTGCLWSGNGREVLIWNPKDAWKESGRLSDAAELARPNPAFSLHNRNPPIGLWPLSVALDEDLGATWDGGINSQIGLYDRRYNATVGRLTVRDSDFSHDHGISEFVFSSEGAILASSADQIQNVKLWDVASGRLLAARTLPNGSSVRLAFTVGDRALAVTAADRTVLYPVRRSRAADEVGVQVTAIEDIDLGPSGELLATAAALPDGTTELNVWDIRHNHRAGHPQRFWAIDEPPPANQARRVAVSCDRQFVGSVLGDSLRTWKLIDRARTVRSAMQTIRGIGYGPDGAIWVLSPNTLTQSSANGETTVASDVQLTCFRIDGAGALLGRTDGWVVRNRLGAGWEKIGKVADVPVTAIDTAGNVIVAGTRSGGITVLRDGRETLNILRAHVGAVTAIAAGPGGWVVSGSDDRTVRVWGPDGRAVLTLPQSGLVRKLFWSHDRHWIITLVDGERAVRRLRLEELKQELADLGIDPDLP